MSEIERKSLKVWLPQQDAITEFEQFAEEAKANGCTVHLNFLRFHPEHSATHPSCTDQVLIKVIPITRPACSRLDSRRYGLEGFRSDSLRGALALARQSFPRGWQLEDMQIDQPATHCWSEASRKAASERMKAYWAKKRSQQTTTEGA